MRRNTTREEDFAVIHAPADPSKIPELVCAIDRLDSVIDALHLELRESNGRLAAALTLLGEKDATIRELESLTQIR